MTEETAIAIRPDAGITPDQLLTVDMFNNDSSFEDIINTTKRVIKGVNKTNLYLVYFIGKVSDDIKLSSKFNKTLEDVAKELNITKSTLCRYRQIVNFCSKEDIQIFADRMIPYTALSRICTIFNTEGGQAVANNILKAMREGTISSLPEVENHYRLELNRSLAMGNAVPGGAPYTDAVDAEVLNDALAEVGDDERSPAERLEANLGVPFSDIESGEDEPASSAPASSSSSASGEGGDDDEDDDEDGGRKRSMFTDTERVLQAKNALKLAESSIGTARRDLKNINMNSERLFETMQNQEDYIIGSAPLFRIYSDKMKDLAQQNAIALGKLLLLQKGMRERGYACPVDVPENALIDELLRPNDGKESN